MLRKRDYTLLYVLLLLFRSSHPEVFLGKGVLKICCKFTGEHPCRSVILIKLQSNVIEITLPHGYSPVNLLHTFRTPFLKNTSGWRLLIIPLQTLIINFLFPLLVTIYNTAIIYYLKFP